MGVSFWGDEVLWTVATAVQLGGHTEKPVNSALCTRVSYMARESFLSKAVIKTT